MVTERRRTPPWLVLALGLGGLATAIAGTPWIYASVPLWVLAVILWIFV